MTIELLQITSTQYHDEAANDYDKGYKSPYWQIYNEITWNYINDCLPKNKNTSLVLDAGGGTGLWSIKLAKLGYKVILTDISDGMLRVARKNIVSEGLLDRIQLIKSDITDMKEFNDNTFDLVLAEGDPVSYCSSPQKAISELSRVARKNAYITVSVDNKLTWLKKNMNKGDFEKANHILQSGTTLLLVSENTGYPAFTFTPGELADLFMKNNIRPLKTVGKPVFIDKQDLNNMQVYDKMLGYELKYGSIPDFASLGGHIAVIGQKEN